MGRNFDHEIEQLKIQQFSFLKQIEFLESLIEQQGYIEARRAYLQSRIETINNEVNAIDMKQMELVRLKSEEMYMKQQTVSASKGTTPNEPVFKVPRAKKKFYENASKNTLVKKHNEAKNDRQCPHCGYKSRTVDAQKFHELGCQVVYDRPQRSDTKKKKKEKKINTDPCEICGKVFPTILGAKTHHRFCARRLYTEKYKPVFNCNYCGTTCKSKPGLISHRRNCVSKTSVPYALVSLRSVTVLNDDGDASEASEAKKDEEKTEVDDIDFFSSAPAVERVAVASLLGTIAEEEEVEPEKAVGPVEPGTKEYEQKFTTKPNIAL